MTTTKKNTSTSATHCTGCDLPLGEMCQPGCPERDAFYASYDNAVRNTRPYRRGGRS